LAKPVAVFEKMRPDWQQKGRFLAKRGVFHGFTPAGGCGHGQKETGQEIGW
jgi:hypothetical protein